MMSATQCQILYFTQVTSVTLISLTVAAFLYEALCSSSSKLLD